MRDRKSGKEEEEGHLERDKGERGGETERGGRGTSEEETVCGLSELPSSNVAELTGPALIE